MARSSAVRWAMASSWMVAEEASVTLGEEGGVGDMVQGRVQNGKEKPARGRVDARDGVSAARRQRKRGPLT